MSRSLGEVFTVHRGLLLLLLASGCKMGPLLPRGDLPTPEQICNRFIEMIQVQRPPEAARLSVASLQLKFEQCVEHNTALAAGEPTRYASVVHCAKHQSLPVNWAVCGFRIEADSGGL